MGIAQDERQRRAAINFCRFARRIHHRTLLGLHLRACRLQRISSGASALENLEGRYIRASCRRNDSLRRAIYRNLKSATTLRLYRRGFANHDRAKIYFAVAAVCDRRATASITAGEQTAESRRGGNNQSRLAYRCAVSPVASVFADLCLRFRALLFVQA